MAKVQGSPFGHFHRPRAAAGAAAAGAAAPPRATSGRDGDNGDDDAGARDVSEADAANRAGIDGEDENNHEPASAVEPAHDPSLTRARPASAAVLLRADHGISDQNGDDSSGNSNTTSSNHSGRSDGEEYHNALTLTYAIVNDARHSAIPNLHLDLTVMSCTVVYVPDALAAIGSAMESPGIIGLTAAQERHLKSLSAAQVRWEYMAKRLIALRRHRRMQQAGSVATRSSMSFLSWREWLARGRAGREVRSHWASVGRSYGYQAARSGADDSAGAGISLIHLSYYFQAVVSHLRFDVSQVYFNMPYPLPDPSCCFQVDSV